MPFDGHRDSRGATADGQRSAQRDRRRGASHEAVVDQGRRPPRSRRSASTPDSVLAQRGDAPRRSRRWPSTRPRTWRSEPSKVDCGRDTPALRGAGSRPPSRRQRHARARDSPHTGRRRQYVAPRSIIAWLNSTRAPAGQQRVRPRRARRARLSVRSATARAEHPTDVGVQHGDAAAEGERAPPAFAV